MLENKAEYTGLELNAIFGEKSLLNIDSDLNIKGISIDSRSVEPGNMFIAMNGENIDGHDKIADAVESGASCIMASKDWFFANADNIKNVSAVIVDDTLDGIGMLANYHRKRFSFPVIAVAGSNGKTTTKDFISYIL